jgi:hypothetical protein
LVSNIRFAFKLFKKNYGDSSNLDVGGEGWQFFLRSIKVRDRLTHPKQASDLSVSDVELVEAIESWNWFRSNIETAQAERIKSLKAEAKKLRAVHKKLKEQRAAQKSKAPAG